jgi:hypothetical protein
MGLPINIENSNKIHGRYGALNGKRPRNPILTWAFSGDLPQIYTCSKNFKDEDQHHIGVKLHYMHSKITIIKDNGCPRNFILRKVTTVVASKVIKEAPKANMKNKSAERPRNNPSSNNRQYRIYTKQQIHRQQSHENYIPLQFIKSIDFTPPPSHYSPQSTYETRNLH